MMVKKEFEWGLNKFFFPSNYCGLSFLALFFWEEFTNYYEVDYKEIIVPYDC